MMLICYGLHDFISPRHMARPAGVELDLLLNIVFLIKVLFLKHLPDIQSFI